MQIIVTVIYIDWTEVSYKQIHFYISLLTVGLLSTELTEDAGPNPVRDLLCVCWGSSLLHWE